MLGGESTLCRGMECECKYRVIFGTSHVSGTQAACLRRAIGNESRTRREELAWVGRADLCSKWTFASSLPNLTSAHLPSNVITGFFAFWPLHVSPLVPLESSTRTHTHTHIHTTKKSRRAPKQYQLVQEVKWSMFATTSGQAKHTRAGTRNTP